MRRTALALLSSLLVAAACSDDAVGPTGDRLTREEALFVAGQVVASGEQTTFTSQQSINARIDPTTFRQDLQFSAPCPLGGQVTLVWHTDLKVDPSAGSLDVDVEGSLAHDACAFPHEGITITVSGNPDIDVDAHASLRNHFQSGEHTVKIDGGFRWSASDGRSGTCPISLDASVNLTTKTKTVEGEVCGHTLHETVTWT